MNLGQVWSSSLESAEINEAIEGGLEAGKCSGGGVASSWTGVRRFVGDGERRSKEPRMGAREEERDADAVVGQPVSVRASEPLDDAM